MADVNFATTPIAGTQRAVRSIVFTNSATGYVFFAANGNNFVYKKSTDGGATWGSSVVIKAVAAIAFDVWFDQWTPSDTGTLIHTWYFDITNDTIFWRTLDTNGDTLGTERSAFVGASAVAGRGCFCSGTKTRSGYLYCAFDIDAGAEHGLVRSTDSGTTWSANLATSFVEATIDQCILLPATGTGDNNDCWAIYQDASADALTMKMWDSSAVAEVESSTIQTMIENTTDGTGQMGFAGSVRHSDGHLVIVSCSDYDTATADMQVWEISGVTAASQTGVTHLTDITTNKDDNYNPQIFIDQITNDIYVAYNGKSDGSETIGTTTKVYYIKSTDGGSTWTGADTAYMEAAAGVVQQVWTPLMGYRFCAAWRITDLFYNKVNSVVTMSPRVSGALSFSGAATKSSARALSASASFVGSTIKRLSRALSATLSFVGALTTFHPFFQALAGTLSFVGAQSRSTLKSLTGALSFIGSFVKSTMRALSAALSFIGSLTKSTARALSGALSFVGAIMKRTSRNFTAAISFIGSCARSAARTLSAALSSAGSLTKSTARALSGAVSFVGSTAKRTSRSFAAALSFIGSIAEQLISGGTQFNQGLAGALSFIGSTSKSTARTLTGALSFSSAFSRLRNKLLEAAVFFSGSVSKTIFYAISGALSFLGGFIYPWEATAELVFSGSLAKSALKTLSGALSFLGGLAKALTSGVTILWKQLIGSNLQAEQTTGELSRTLTSSQLEVISTQSNP